VKETSIDDDTVLFSPKITYFFQPHLSVGSEKDVFTLINIPLAVSWQKKYFIAHSK